MTLVSPGSSRKAGSRPRDTRPEGGHFPTKRGRGAFPRCRIEGCDREAQAKRTICSACRKWIREHDATDQARAEFLASKHARLRQDLPAKGEVWTQEQIDRELAESKKEFRPRDSEVKWSRWDHEKLELLGEGGWQRSSVPHRGTTGGRSKRGHAKNEQHESGKGRRLRHFSGREADAEEFARSPRINWYAHWNWMHGLRCPRVIRVIKFPPGVDGPPRRHEISLTREELDESERHESEKRLAAANKPKPKPKQRTRWDPAHRVVLLEGPGFRRVTTTTNVRPRP